MWVVNGGISERGAYTHHAVMRSGHQYIHEIERKRDREREREGEWERGGEKSEIGREKKGVLKGKREEGKANEKRGNIKGEREKEGQIYGEKLEKSFIRLQLFFNLHIGSVNYWWRWKVVSWVSLCPLLSAGVQPLVVSWVSLCPLLSAALSGKSSLSLSSAINSL